MVVFGKKVVVFEQNGWIRAKKAVFGKQRLVFGEWMYSGISGCIRAKWLYSAEVFGLGQSGCIRVKVVEFWQKLL